MRALEVFEAADEHDRRLAISASGALGEFNRAGVLTAADVHIARTLARAAREQDEAAVLGAAFATRAVRLGSVAVDLARLAADASRAGSPRVGSPPTAPSPGAASTSLSAPVTVECSTGGGAVNGAWSTQRRSGAESAGANLPWPAADTWVQRVAASKLVSQGALVVEHGLVYLQRYHAQEVQVVADLLARAARPAPLINEALLAEGLDRHFGAEDSDQRATADLALRSWTTVVTGGPGTGKTTTAATILALLAEQSASAGSLASAGSNASAGSLASAGSNDSSDSSSETDSGSGPLDKPPTSSGPGITERSARPLRVGLAAPTGKAAARMQEALTAALLGSSQRAGIIELTPEPLRPAVERLQSVEAITLHRLLGKLPDSGTRFRHHRGNRLPHDVVLVDEASMVSLTHMARLLEALRPDARLVLVGDPDQLVSVDAGAVLADLVAGAEAATSAPMSSAPAVQVARLGRVHRFGARIGDLAQALRTGDADALVALLRAGRDAGAHSEVLWVEDPDPANALEGLLTRQARTVYTHAQAGDAAGALTAMSEHRLLCAHRRGPFGVTTWNARIEGWLREATGDGLYDPMYVGRPLLITANDYSTGVVNGDTGVVVAARGPMAQATTVGDIRQARGRKLAVIAGDGNARPSGSTGSPAPEGTATGLRVFAPSRLGDVDTLHAMTIHKAQGSQADAVTVLLPEEDSPLLTRELLYTGITRAKSQVRVVGSEATVRAAVERRVVRASGLRQRLSDPEDSPPTPPVL